MGPLAGIRILELAGIGPGPFAGMMLADMGAEVIHIDRPGGNPIASFGHSVLFRNRHSLALNLKTPQGAQALLKLCESADALFEGFRPGVAERLGIGPDACMAANPKLVYGRMTGWGQTGPLSARAGHDINYISLSGVLHAIGRQGEKPVPPLNLVGDFGGGGMLLAFGIICALLEAKNSGQGQVVDAAMVEGSATLMAMFSGLNAQGLFSDVRGTHMLDTGAPFYEVYATADGQYVSVGAIEPQFHAILMQTLGVNPKDYGQQMDQQRWPQQKAILSAAFKQKTRDEWDALFRNTDACVAPVISLHEAPQHPHNQARGSFVDVAGTPQPAPAPRFSRSQPQPPQAQVKAGSHSTLILTQAGFSRAEIDALIQQQVVYQA